MPTGRIVEAGTEDLPTLAACLARAFEHDPVNTFLFPRAATRVTRSTHFYLLALRHLASVGVIYTDERRHGAAVWEPWPPVASHPLLDLGSRVAMALTLNIRFGRARRLARAVESGRPTGFRLAFVGVDPAHQRQGLGSALLRPALLTCDVAGMPAVLDTRGSNVPFYERRGFQVVREVKVLPNDSLWTMARQPRKDRDREE